MKIRVKQSEDGLWKWRIDDTWQGGYPTYRAAYDAASAAMRGEPWQVAVVRFS